jgi:hypothetical protein
MKWKKKILTVEKGTIRIVHKFLWKPLTIGDETRWLEKTTWEQIWKIDSDGVGRWVYRKWI